MCCWFDIVRLTGRGGSRSVKLTHHERWWVWDEGGDRLALAFVVGMRGHHERWWVWDEGGEMGG